jgi:hypothetical protein
VYRLSESLSHLLSLWERRSTQSDGQPVIQQTLTRHLFCQAGASEDGVYLSSEAPTEGQWGTDIAETALD